MNLYDLPDINPELKQIAEDYPGRLNEDCYYSTPCIIGELFTRLEIDVPGKFDGKRVSRIPWVQFGENVFTARALDTLQKIQDRADEGALWSDAINT